MRTNYKFVFLALTVIGLLVVAGCSEKVNAPDVGDKTTGDSVLVFKSPGCGCCEGYIGELNRQGFSVEVTEVNDIISIKDKYKIPAELRSCHTAFVNGYFIEGHVPIEAVNKMLSEKPDIDGIILEGMPPGSPGMPGQKTQQFKVYSSKDGIKQEYMKI